jgi:cation diffusion facilitator family transporter
VQAVLIFTTSGLIIYSAVRRIIFKDTLEFTEAGIGVMVVSIVASILLSRHLFRVSRATDSPALEAIAHNIAADVYSAAGVLVGLVVIRFTGLNILDPIVALAVALIIIKAAYNVLRKSFGGLIDTRLPGAEEAEIMACIKEHSSELVGFHKLRTRKAGSQRYIDLHLVMHKNASLEKAHQMCDHLEQDLKSRLTNASITIHVEPCGIECEQCSVSSDLRQAGPSS